MNMNIYATESVPKGHMQLSPAPVTNQLREPHVTCKAKCNTSSFEKFMAQLQQCIHVSSKINNQFPLPFLIFLSLLGEN